MKDFVKMIFDFGAKKCYMLWFSEFNNGFYKEGDLLICFSKESLLDTYCDTRNLVLSKEPVIFKMSDYSNWLSKKAPLPSFDALLTFWNICSDLSFTMEDEFLGDEEDEETEAIYDLLFDACEDPKGVTLTSAQLDKLAEVMTDGMELVRTYVKPLK